MCVCVRDFCSYADTMLITVIFVRARTFFVRELYAGCKNGGTVINVILRTKWRKTYRMSDRVRKFVVKVRIVRGVLGYRIITVWYRTSVTGVQVIYGFTIRSLKGGKGRKGKETSSRFAIRDCSGMEWRERRAGASDIATTAEQPGVHVQWTVRLKNDNGCDRSLQRNGTEWREQGRRIGDRENCCAARSSPPVEGAF